MVGSALGVLGGHGHRPVLSKRTTDNAEVYYFDDDESENDISE